MLLSRMVMVHGALPLTSMTSMMVLGCCLLASRLAQAQFISRPDIVAAPWDISYTAPGANISDGYVFLAQRVQSPVSLSIYTPTGDMVYFSQPANVVNSSNGAFNFRPQILNGTPVLTYWEGYAQTTGYGFGHIVVLAQNYSQIANVTSNTGGTLSDIHESRITSNGTMLSTLYPTVDNVDTTALAGGVASQQVLDGCLVEFSIPDSTPIFRFCPLEGGGVTIEESYLPVDTTVPWDYIHVNSVVKDDLGNYLLSGRHTSTLYYISGSTGQILWRLGGKNSNFTTPGRDEGDPLFSWQHDAQFARESSLTPDQLANTTTRFISVYNNAGNGGVVNQTSSNGLLLELNLTNMSATTVANFSQPGGATDLLSASQGSFEVFESDSPTPDFLNAFIGYGSLPVFAEWDVNGTALQVVRWGNATASQSYRAFKAPWQGFPTTAPDVAIQDGTLYVSWNGATEVSSWRMVQQGGSNSNSSTDVPKTSFETAIPLNTSSTAADVMIQAIALSSNGTQLASSQFIMLNGTLTGTGAINGTSQSTPISTGSTSGGGGGGGGGGGSTDGVCSGHRQSMTVTATLFLLCLGALLIA